MDEAAAALDPADFTDPLYREIYAALCSDPDSIPVPGAGMGTDPTGGDVAAPAPAVSDAAAGALRELLADRQEFGETDRMYGNLVDDIRSERLHRRLDELDQLLPLAESKGEQETVRALMRERIDLAQELRKMERGVERRVRKRGRGPSGPRGGPRR